VNYRTAQLLAPEDLGASGTKVINIDIDQPISRLEIRFQTTKASQGMSAASPANISKIEIVDGSTVLWSATGYECQAVAYYNNPGMIFDHGQHISTLGEVDIYRIDFGRWLWDTELAFMPGQYVNPQLRITWDEDVSDTSVTANELEVLAYLFDEKQVSPQGYLSVQEWFSYTVGAEDAFETIMLPEDHLIRGLYVRAFRDGFEPWAQIDEVRFDENNQQRVPFEYTNLENYYRAMKSVHPPIVQPFAFIADTGSLNFYVAPTDYYSGFVAAGLGATTEVFHEQASSKGGKLDIDASANTNALGLAFGWLPWHTFRFDMGYKMDMTDWYNPSGKRPRLRLRAASSGTNGTAQVVLEQLRRF
jgi:hypothetical protein